MLATTFRNFLARFKDIVWPIEKKEMVLFVPMALMMLCVLFNFGALRTVKDSLVVPNIGAEVISFLKLWLVLPASVLFTIIYVKLSNSFNFEYVFYIITTGFITFFLVFAFIIYPNQEFYHPDPELIEQISLNHPNFKWFIKIAGSWSYAIMYIFSELWSVVVINLMFWQFANHVFDIKSAKRIYPILGMVGNLGLILAGNVLVAFSDMSGIEMNNGLKDVSPVIQNQLILKPIITSIFFAGLLAMVLFRFINSVILRKRHFTKELHLHRVTEETKTKLSLKESFLLVARSKYIGHIVLLILCYGLLINILEGPWKNKVRSLYPNTADYLNFMGQFNIWMGVSCISFMVIASNVLRRLSWLTAALFTPFMIAATGFTFFMFVILSDNINWDFLGLNPIYAAVFVGAVQNILSKSTKYSLFDATKEMTYIPIPLELRTKGKAAAEIIGIKFGKSLGAFTQSIIFMIVPTATFDSITTYLLGVFVVIVCLWFWNVVQLNKEYLKVSE